MNASTSASPGRWLQLMLTKTLPYLFFGGLIVSCATFSKPVVASCEKEIISYEQRDDTTKSVLVKQTMVSDTTANLVSGTISSRKGTPIKNAIIEFKQENRQFSDTTNESGEFKIFENSFHGFWKMFVAHQQYRCLEVDSVKVGGGQVLIIKLNEQY